MNAKMKVGALVAAILLAPGAAARAQAQPEGWQVTLAPYMMGAGMNGTTGIGKLESDVSLSASDVFSNLQFGMMGYFEVRKGRWGVGADIIWMALGSSTDKPLPANIDVDQGGFTFVAVGGLSRALDVRAGVVINTLRPSIVFKQPINKELSRTETWVDPVVGINLHTPDTGGRLGFAMIADVGGFGVGSDLLVNAQPTVAVRFTKGVGMAFGYRWIYVKYENPGDETTLRFLYDMTSSGPFAGFIFRF